MPGKTVIQVLNVIGFLTMVFVNIAANTIPINNKSTEYISNLYPNLFTPAGFTFAIWGVIYLGLLGFSIYQARDIISPNKQEMPFLKKIGYLFFISSLLNTAWIFAWHYLQPALSLAIIVALLLVLIRIYLNLEIGIKAVPSKVRLWVNLPFRIYLGWITIATIANVTAVLVHYDWNRFGLSEVFWTVVMIVAATAITVAFLKVRKDVVVSMVSMWALFGIAVERITSEPVEIAVVVSSILAIVIIGALAIFVAKKTAKDKRNTKKK